MRWTSILLFVLCIPSAWAGPAPGDSPSLSFTTVDGTELGPESLAGRVVLLDFWATWCEPCTDALPYYQTLHALYGEAGLVIVAVSVDEDPTDVEAFRASHDLAFHVVWDGEHDLVSHWSPTTMPTSYLVDRDGVLRAVHAGFSEESPTALDAEIQQLLAEGGGE